MNWNPFKRAESKPATPAAARAGRGGRGGKRNFAGGIGAYNNYTYSLPLKSLHRSIFQRHGLSLLTNSIPAIRRFALTNPFIVSYIRNMLDGIIGSKAITPSFSTVQDNTARQQLKADWADFASDMAMYGTMTMRDFQRAVMQSFLTDGRTFIIINFEKEKAQYPYGFRLLHLEKEMLAVSLCDEGKGIVNGIEYDNGVISKYHFYDYSDVANVRGRSYGDGNAIRGIIATSDKTKEVDAAYVIDFMESGSTNESYNYPPKIVSVIESCLKIESIDAYTLETMEGQSKHGGFLKTSIETPTPENDPPLHTGDIPDEVSDPNELVVLAPGMEYQDFARSVPNMETVAMRREILRSIAASLGVDYAALNSDGKEANYSSMRAFSLLTRQTFFTMQKLLEEKLMSRVLRSFLTVRANTPDEVKNQAIMTAYESRVHHAVDPLKDAAANKMAVEQGIKSANSLAREYGGDVKDNLMELVHIFDEMGEENIAKASAIRAIMHGGVMEMPPDDDDEKTEKGKDDETTDTQ